MANDVEPERLVGTDEVAEFLGRPRSWIHDNQARLEIPRIKVGQQFRYRLSEVAEWVEAHRVAR